MLAKLCTDAEAAQSHGGLHHIISLPILNGVVGATDVAAAAVAGKSSPRFFIDLAENIIDPLSRTVSNSKSALGYFATPLEAALVREQMFKSVSKKVLSDNSPNFSADEWAYLVAFGKEIGIFLKSYAKT